MIWYDNEEKSTWPFPPIRSCHVFSWALIPTCRSRRTYWRLDECCCGDNDAFSPTDNKRIIDRSADADKFVNYITEHWSLPYVDSNLTLVTWYAWDGPPTDRECNNIMVYCLRFLVLFVSRVYYFGDGCVISKTYLLFQLKAYSFKNASSSLEK